jgi:hypothetical protein
MGNSKSKSKSQLYSSRPNSKKQDDEEEGFDIPPFVFKDICPETKEAIESFQNLQKHKKPNGDVSYLMKFKRFHKTNSTYLQIDSSIVQKS